MLLFAIVVCAFKFTANLETTMDVSLADEGIYLNSGRQLESVGLVNAEYAPGYQLWYYGLSKLVPDPIHLYHANYRILICLFVAFFFVALRQLRVGSLLAFLAAVYALNSFSMLVWPYCSSLAATTLMAAVAAAAFFRSLTSKLAVLTAGLLVAAYVRPELFLASIAILSCLTICCVTSLIKRRESIAATTGSLIFGVSVFCLAVATLGNPFAGKPNEQGSRTFIAFGQHYAYKVVMDSGEQEDPWTRWQSIAGRDFGDAKSVAGALAANPTAFTWNIFANLKHSLENIPKLFIPNRAFLVMPWRTMALIGIVVGLLIWFRYGENSEQKSQAISIDPSLIILLGCLLLSLLPAAFIIFPRSHYAVPAASIVMLMIAITFYRRMPKVPARLQNQSLVLTAILAVVFAITITPHREDAPHKAIRNGRPMAFAKSAQLMRRLAQHESIEALGADLDWKIFVDQPVSMTTPFQPSDLIATLNNKQIDVIVDEPQFRLMPVVANDKPFSKLLAEPESHGYVAVRFCDRPVWQLLIRRDLHEQLSHKKQ